MIVLAIRDLHAQGQVLHRDIKPENILLDVDTNGIVTRVKLIDFGQSCCAPEKLK